MPIAKSLRKQEFVYPEVSVRVCVGKNALTAEIAMQLLGWESETKDVKFHDTYLFVDDVGNKIRCLYNSKNRPFDEKWARCFSQEILNRRWKLNLETIIIGKNGQVLSGQHRLIGLVLASQIWNGEYREHWLEKWETEPVIETLVAFGADESEEFTRTLDNVKPRTLADVLFTSATFSQHRPKDRKPLARILDYAVRILWQRTGLSDNPYISNRTHSEALEFIGNHPRLLECVKFIYNENNQGSISNYIGLGYAAGLLYLMASSDDDPNKYASRNPRREKFLTLSRWDDAIQFWEGFSIDPSFSTLRDSILKVAELDDGEGVSIHDRISIIVQGWNRFVKGESLEGELIKPLSNGEAVGVGGIDLGGV